MFLCTFQAADPLAAAGQSSNAYTHTTAVSAAWGCVVPGQDGAQE